MVDIANLREKSGELKSNLIALRVNLCEVVRCGKA